MKKVIGGIICLFVCLLIVVFLGDNKEESAKQILANADKAYYLKKYDDAKGMYAKLAEKYKDTESGKKAIEVLADYDQKLENIRAEEKAEAEAHQAKFDELTNAFNVVFSRNKFKELYSGVKYESGLNTLRIYVNDNWFYIPKGVKEHFVDSSATVWFGMQGARGMKPDTSVSIYIHNEGSNRKLASWGDIRGVVIND